MRKSLDGAEVLFVALSAAVSEEVRDLRLGHRLSLSGSMRPLCIDAAHFATVDLLRPSAEAASFQLTPFRSWAIFSFLLVMNTPF